LFGLDLSEKGVWISFAGLFYTAVQFVENFPVLLQLPLKLMLFRFYSGILYLLGSQKVT
jgi:hypothetical protein